MRRGIIAHGSFIDENNADELARMNFVFLCLDGGLAKAASMQVLQRAAVPFIDVGMGVRVIEGALTGALRVTTSARGNEEHVAGLVPLIDGDVENDYARNIQIAELNSLNAALAVIKWKKLCGFYADGRREYSTFYSINENALVNEHCA
jgi:hypothetical protein